MGFALRPVVNALRGARSVVVCGHVRPDGDAIGSVLGLTLALRRLGISAIPTFADAGGPPAVYAWLPGFSLFTVASSLAVPDVFIALDSPDPARLGMARELAESAGRLVVLDHHPAREAYGDVHIAETTAGAVGQLVWQLCEELDVERDVDIALCCYVALITDTGRFTYQNTTASVMRTAAEMIDAGIRPSDVARELYQSRSLAAVEMESRAASRLTVTNAGKVAYLWLDESDFAETGASEEETENLTDLVRSIKGVEVGLVLRGAATVIRGNLRSKTQFDVSAIAQRFGGGGHRAAAGFSVHGSTIESVLESILPLLPGGSEAA